LLLWWLCPHSFPFPPPFISLMAAIADYKIPKAVAPSVRRGDQLVSREWSGGINGLEGGKTSHNSINFFPLFHSINNYVNIKYVVKFNDSSIHNSQKDHFSNGQIDEHWGWDKVHMHIHPFIILVAYNESRLKFVVLWIPRKKAFNLSREYVSNSGKKMRAAQTDKFLLGNGEIGNRQWVKRFGTCNQEDNY
jgi:hypothetical protein